MKNLLVVFCLLLASRSGLCADRFGRPVVKVSDQKAYQFVQLDDVGYPALSNSLYDITCLVYRGTQRYHVEIGIKNKTAAPVALPMDFVAFEKPGYTVYRTDTMAAAKEAAAFAGIGFVPTLPPYIAPTTDSTINGTATTYGDQTYIHGTATTTTDNSGQAGANLGNAIGNAIAARRFYKGQGTDAVFSHYLAAHLQTDSDLPLQAGDSRVIVATFEQAKQKKALFSVTLQIGSDKFRFSYKE